MATIQDVARLAGVSTSTVSYVLSGKRTISAATRGRVERAVRELGYRPHAGARALASSRTNVLGLVVPLRADIAMGVIMQFVRAVVVTARTFDHDVLMLTAEEPTALERATSGSLVDAMIVMDIEAEDPRVPRLAALSRPTVLIGVPDDPRGLSCVDFDFHGASRLAVAHLHGLGHRRVAMIGSSPRTMARHAGYADRAREGFTHAVAARSMDGRPWPCEPTPAAVRACLDAIDTAQPGWTGLVVHNEEALPSLLAALVERGRLVGEGGLSIVAIAPADAVANLPSPLTFVEIPALEIGRAAVEMVMARLETPEPPEVRLLSPRLTDRGSTARVD